MIAGPLGKYSQVVAAILAVLIVGSAIVLHALNQADSFVDNIALIAVGAVFGAAASTAVSNSRVNGLNAKVDQVLSNQGNGSSGPSSTGG